VRFNAIVVAVRRRARDLAVLRVIGYTRRQTAEVVLTMAVAAGAFALTIGMPFGIVAGRALWQSVARGASVEGDALVPVGWIFVIGAGVLVTTVLIALLPTRRAASMRLVTQLRAE
jgi:ABC-type antimicrobial peptide transport system permease subunit